jgi:hypothetical protein
MTGHGTHDSADHYDCEAPGWIQESESNETGTTLRGDTR